MSKETIIILLIGFALGYMVGLFIEVVQEVIAEHRVRRNKQMPVDSTFDYTNPLNSPSWERKVINGKIMYMLHDGGQRDG